MAHNKPRNRCVIFRLTQEEFNYVETVSSASGARSLSEFARLKLLHGAKGAEPSLAEIEKKLDDLAGVVQSLAETLSQKR